MQQEHAQMLIKQMMEDVRFHNNNLLQRPLALVLIGLPGSGKTTFAKQVFGNNWYNQAVVSSDHVLESYAVEMNSTYNDVFETYIKQATRQMHDKLTELTKRNHMVIWDQTNVSNKKQRKIVKQLPDHYFKVAMVFDKDEHTIEKNLKQREAISGKTIPAHAIEQMKQAFTQPVPGLFDMVTVIDSQED